MIRNIFSFLRGGQTAPGRKELQVYFSAASDVGRMRETNQDNLYVMRPILSHEELLHYMAHGKEKLPALFAVCDGMGGGKNGEKAAWEAIKVIEQAAAGDLEKKTDRELEKLFQRLCQRMNDMVFHRYGNTGSLVGCTVTLLYIDAQRIYLVNVGDSPGMCYQEDGITVLTHSDNRANQMYLMGLISEEERWIHATKNQLTQHIGMNPDEVRLSPHICRMDYPEEQVTYLICSDGLLDKNSFENLKKLFRETTIEQLSAECVKQAMECGSRDNITAIAVRVGVKET